VEQAYQPERGQRIGSFSEVSLTIECSEFDSCSMFKNWQFFGLYQSSWFQSILELLIPSQLTSQPKTLVESTVSHLFTCVKALGIGADFVTHVAWNVWPENDKREDDEKKNDAGDT
jgi:hypothetical protein